MGKIILLTQKMQLNSIAFFGLMSILVLFNSGAYALDKQAGEQKNSKDLVVNNEPTQELENKIKEAIEKQTGEKVEDIKIEKIEKIDTLPPIPQLASITFYTVAEGDCLWNIAKKPEIYNNPLQWQKVYKANQDKIKNPNLIYHGQILIIPRDLPPTY